ncbi:MAG: alkaline phosphatase D family protein [Pseudomonadota bacterium]
MPSALQLPPGIDIGSLSRRRCLLALSAIFASTVTPAGAAEWKASDDPFTLGVASGDPSSDGFVIWTRLAPKPTHGGGMPAVPVAVEWTIASDEGHTRILRRGRATADPRLGHSVHVEVDGLDPDRWYWYRFTVGGAASPTGRTRTCPAPGAPSARLRFAFASCQHYEHGLFGAYRHLAQDDLDLVLHLGDYIYEGSSAGMVPRRHETKEEPVNLEQYRNRYACYKSDAHLREAHRNFPWVVTWDDHEVENDYAASLSQNRDDPAWFLQRRAAAYQAYYEHMPLRRASLPRGPDLLLYRRVAFGDLATFHVLDNRQYRSDQPCGEGRSGGGNMVPDCTDRFDPAATLWGGTQEAWLDAGLVASRSHWNVLAQSLMMAQLTNRNAAGRPVHWTDGWDGYAAPRARFLSRVAATKASNPLTIGGDIHSFWASELKADFDDPKSPVVMPEFVGTSISSRGIPYESTLKALPDNPHIRYFDSRQRGYARCEVSRARLQAVFRGLADAADEQSSMRTLASFVVESGRPNLNRE